MRSTTRASALLRLGSQRTPRPITRPSSSLLPSRSSLVVVGHTHEGPVVTPTTTTTTVAPLPYDVPLVPMVSPVRWYSSSNVGMGGVGMRDDDGSAPLVETDLEVLERNAATFEEWNEVVRARIKAGDLTHAERLLRTELRTRFPNTTPCVDTLTHLLNSHLQSHEEAVTHYHQQQQSLVGNTQPPTTTTVMNTNLLLNRMLWNVERADVILRSLQKLAPSSSSSSSSSSSPSNSPSNLRNYHERLVRAWHDLALSYRHSSTLLPRGVPQRAQYHLRSISRPVLPPPTTPTTTEDTMAEAASRSPSVQTINKVLQTWSISDETHFASMAESVFRKSFGALVTGSKKRHSGGGGGGGGGAPAAATKNNNHTMEANVESLRIMLRVWCRAARSVEADDNNNDDGAVLPASKEGAVVVVGGGSTRGSAGFGGTAFRSTGTFKATGYLMRMQQLLEEGREEFEPELEDYLVLFRSWGSGHGGRALSVLRKMESLYQNRRTTLRPDSSCYTQILRILSRSDPRRQPPPGPASDALLTSMNDDALFLGTDAYSYAIRTWCNHVEVGARDVASYRAKHRGRRRNNGGLGGGGGTAAEVWYAKEERKRKTVLQAAERAEEILEEMEVAYHKNATVVVRAGREDYDAVVKAYSRCAMTDGAMERAERLVSRMERGRDDLNGEGDTAENDISPTVETYISLVRGYADASLTDNPVSRARNAMERALSCYRNGDESCRPTAEVFNALLSVCGSRVLRRAGREMRREAVACAVDMLALMREEGKKDPICLPTSRTYVLLLEAFEIVLDEDGGGSSSGGDGRLERAVETTFNRCCEEGLVDDLVLRTVQRMAPYNLYRRIVLLKAKSLTSSAFDGNGEDVEGVLVLPMEWTENAVRRGRKQYYIPLTTDGSTLPNDALSIEQKMKNLRSQKNKKILQGGRS